MARIYITYFGSAICLGILLITTTIAMFVFKQKLHGLKIELANIDSMINEEKKRSAMLEANKTLQHSSGYLKKIADKTLPARFTTVKQFVALNDLKPRNPRAVLN